ncbi:methylisocitrate lyase [Cladophialophora yegresii CBS 114405]|uniref:Methylisocitrate lyase n=1 Tax=Cladophialophora yegresii CBS 114405 TaxID=1182544 RepID=W9W8D5_9EURO|nr:methylisocitrate lyase [Cladophialophora yegresii CBS 114405]EXJ64332.1 methylisocitrate lyase [Cladophialophora yegresii CBS 114405]
MGSADTSTSLTSATTRNTDTATPKACSPLTGASRLREMLHDPSKVVVCPGVFDGLTARLALAAGYDALYMTGAGTSMSRLGWADLGLATLNDMRANAEMIASLDPSVPVLADADTGYGGPIMVTRTVTQYARAGVAALHIEDQVQEKRCGHLLGKQIVDRAVFLSRLRAAVSARNNLHSDMLIIARTDARQTYGFEEAVARLQEAIKVGVDVVFPEALQSHEEMAEMCRRMAPTPVLLNVVPGGVTPECTIEEARGMGFRVIIYPGLCISAVVESVAQELKTLKTTGTTSSRGSVGAGVSIKDAFNLCGLQECIDVDRQAGGKAYDTVNGEE